MQFDLGKITFLVLTEKVGNHMKRMLCFVSDQLLPNFIPINEPATRPDGLHAVFTPSEPRMQQRWTNLKAVLARNFPSVQLNDFPIADAYDARAVQRQCEDLLSKHDRDEWSLNATGGTKLMSSPADEVFRRRLRNVYYVETPRHRILKIAADWSLTEIPFSSSIDLQTYFELHGRTATVGNSRSTQEAHVIRQLERLDWRVWPSVCLLRPGSLEEMAEFDAIGIHAYQLFAFECKRLTVKKDDVRSGRVHRSVLSRVSDDILFDLYKLSQVRNSFGGPFGKSYWIFSGGAELSENDKERISEFGITLISGQEINELAKAPEKFGLPPRKAGEKRAAPPGVVQLN